MFGRVRASPVSSLNSFELERPSPKITKQDSLSIYEATLLMLKQGSHRSPLEDCPSTDKQHGMTILQVEPQPSAADSCPKSDISFQSTFSIQQCEGKNMSILCFFSKCKNSGAQTSTDEELASGYCSSSSVSANSVYSSYLFK